MCVEHPISTPSSNLSNKHLLCECQVWGSGLHTVLNSNDRKTFKTSPLFTVAYSRARDTNLPPSPIHPCKTTKPTTMKIIFRRQDPRHITLLLFAKSLLHKIEVKTGHQQTEGNTDDKKSSPGCPLCKLFRSGNLLSQESADLTGETESPWGHNWMSASPKEPDFTRQVELAPTANVPPGPNTEEPRITSIVLPVPRFPMQGQKESDKNLEFAEPPR